MTTQRVLLAARVARPLTRTRLRPLVAGEIVVVIVLLKVYDYVRRFAHLHEHAALRHALTILSVERFLHIDVERSVNAWFVRHRGISTAAAWWYEYAHVGVALAVLASCYVFAPTVYRSARNALVLTNCAGMVIYLVLPVMPPRLLPHPQFVDVLELAGFNHTTMSRVTEDQFGAMPSLHIAWATWVAIVLYQMLRRFTWRPVVYVYPVVTAVVVVGTANHYVLDLVAGLAVTVIAARLTGLCAQGALRPAETRGQDRR